MPIAIIAYIKEPGQISWISFPTYESVKSFLVEITGNQGTSLLALYLLFQFVGFLFGEGLGGQRTEAKWKLVLMVDCFILPIGTALVISKIITPIFLDKYLLYVMPYLAILAANCIVTIASLGLQSERFRLLSVSIGIGALALFIMFSDQGIRSYFDDYQKSDWRGATQFLTARCSESLRLYYPTYMNLPVLYYNPALDSQVADGGTRLLMVILVQMSLPLRFQVHIARCVWRCGKEISNRRDYSGSHSISSQIRF